MTTTEILTGIKNWVVGKLNLKQNVISDLADIRSGAQAGATSVQPADILSYFDNAVYDSGTHRINFYHGQSVIAYIDASPFIVDGMVNDVRIENGYLVIDFNTDSGKQDISIPLTDIFNPNNYYTKSETDSQLTQKQSEIDDLYARIGYYVCSTEGNVAAKTIVANNYTLGNGGSIKIKMTNTNTVNNATLNINSTGAKALYYDGERASAKNSWEAGETVEVYYDGTSFYANNVAGGSGSGDGAFDVSVKYPTSGVDGGNTYTLKGALSVLNANLSASKKKGGMSIKFVQSSDSKYVQWRYMGTSVADADFVNVVNWQGVDDEPTAGSDNLVKSGGVADSLNKKPIFNLSVLYPTEGYNADGTSGGSYYTLKQAMLTIASHINDNLIDGRPAFRESIVLFRAFDEVNNVVFNETAAFLLTGVWSAEQAKNVFNYILLNPFYKKIWITDTTGVNAAGSSPLDSGVWDILFNEDYLEKGDYYIRTNILSDVPTGLFINAPVASGSGRQNTNITLNQNNYYQTSKVSIGEGRVRYGVKEGNANILNNINFRLESVAEHEERISYIQNLFDKKIDKITVVDYIENGLNVLENFSNINLSANRNFHYIQARAKENFSLGKSLPSSISSIFFYKEGGSRITLDTPVNITKGEMFYINSVPAEIGAKVPVEDFINSVVIGTGVVVSPKYLFSNVEVGDDGELLKKKMIRQSFGNAWYFSDFIEVVDKSNPVTLTYSPSQVHAVIYLYGYDANKSFVVKSDLGGRSNYAHLDNGSHNIAYVRVYWKTLDNSFPSSIESISKNFTVENLASESLPKTLTKFYNKKVYAIGDSITDGYGEGYSWVRKFAELSSALRSYSKATTSHAYNTSVSGASIIDDGQLADIPADSDFILILLGINDYGMRACPLGEKNSSDTTTFYGALNYVYNYLLTNHSDKEIVVFSPILSSKRDIENAYGLKPRDYSNAIIEKCIEFGLKYVDGWCSELNSNNQANAEMYYKYKHFESSDPDEDIIDGTHLGIAGEERLAQFIFNNGAY